MKASQKKKVTKKALRKELENFYRNLDSIKEAASRRGEETSEMWTRFSQVLTNLRDTKILQNLIFYNQEEKEFKNSIKAGVALLGAILSQLEKKHVHGFLQENIRYLLLKTENLLDSF